MKQELEVGDRVEMVSAPFSKTFVGTKGIVVFVAEHAHADGKRTVSFALNDKDRTRLGRAPGFSVTTSSNHLKYLKPKKDEALKIDEKFGSKVDELSDVLMKPTPASTTREQDLTMALAKAIEALDVLAYIEISGDTPGLKAIKKAMLVELA